MMKQFTHDRVHLLGYILLAILAVFILRLFYLQVIQHEHYANLANREQVKRLVIPAKRGLIYAMDGGSPVKLVLNQQVYSVIADPQIVKNEDIVIDTVRQVAGGTAVDNIRSLLEDKTSRYAVLATKLSHKQAELIKDADLSGVGLRETARRVYPEGKLAAQTLGFVNADGKGQYGVEGALNKQLAGEDGVLQSVTDISNVPLTLGKDNIRKEPVDGKDIVLSIDRNIQAYATSALARGMKQVGAKNGSVIVMNPNNGQVMAMASLPAYNPEEFTKVKDALRFINGPTMIPYEPGSVIKPFTMATGIDKGVITPNSTYTNLDYIVVEDQRIPNAITGLTGTRTMQEVLNHSLNTGVVTVAQRLGNGDYVTNGARETIYHYFHDQFGMGQTTGIEVQGETPGVIHAPGSEYGNAVQYANMSFGQGMTATMAQVAAGYCSLVNGGVYYQPTVIAGEYKNDQLIPKEPKVVRRPVKTSTANTVREMVYKARQSVHIGDRQGYYVGGKTGTAEVAGQEGGYAEDTTIGSYTGFGGTKKRSEYVIMIQIASPGKNIRGVDAVPVFTDISNWLLQYLRVQPKG